MARPAKRLENIPKGRENWTAADIAADAADAEKAAAAAALKAAVAADPKKTKQKQKQEQAIRNQRCYRKSKGRGNWTAADIAADAEAAAAAAAALKAAVATDPKNAKRKQQHAICQQRCHKKSKGRENSTEHSR